METKQKILIARIVVAAAIFALSFFSFLGELGKLIVSLVGFLIIAYDVIFESIKGIFHGEIFDEKFLMLIASIGAFAIKEYHEALAVMLFYQLGEFLQDLAVDKSKDSIKKLMDIRPDYANLKLDDETKKVDPMTVSVGDLIVIYPGEKVPLDGVIVSGASSFDTASLTGESLPKELAENDTVLAGMINISSIITVKVTKKFSESSVSKIIELVENAENKKAKSENFITKFAKIYTPTVVVFAILLAVLPPLAFGGVWSEWIHRALLFLVVSCPCALVISIPLTFFVGIGGASKKGVLIKGASHIETLAKVNCVCFDKTGTLTKGNFSVSKICGISVSDDELLKITALAETGLSHPISKSIVSLAKTKFSLSESDVTEQTNLPGLGLKAKVKGKQVFVGNAKLMAEQKIDTINIDEIGTTLFVSDSKKLLGYIVIADEIKESSANAVAVLKKLSVSKVCMLTGDKAEVAKSVTTELKIDECYSELLPEDKARIVGELKANKNTSLAYVGDGINDAPVLKLADIGISMGKLGSDIATEAADATIMDDNPYKLAEAIKLSRKTMRIVKENIVFTIAFKLAMLVLGALGITSMWLAIVADVGVSLIAILNSLRALKTNKK